MRTVPLGVTRHLRVTISRERLVLARDRRKTVARARQAIDPQFTYGHARPGSALAREIGAAYLGRCVEAGYGYDQAWIAALLAGADEVSVMRSWDGDLLAWGAASWQGAQPTTARRLAVALLGCALVLAGAASAALFAHDGSPLVVLAGCLALTCAAGLIFALAATWPAPRLYQVLAGMNGPGAPDGAVWVHDDELMAHARGLGFRRLDWGPGHPHMLLTRGAKVTA